MRNKEKGVKKAVIVKFKGKHTHNSTDHLRNELRKKSIRDGRNLKSQKNIFSNVQSYSELFLDEKKGSSSQSKILGNTVDYFSPKKALEKNKEVSKDMKEKVSSLKAQKEKPTQNQKKTVNFNQQRMKGQKTEKNFEEENKDSENNNEIKKKIPEKDFQINRSMGNLNKKNILKNNSIDVADSMEQSINVENEKIYELKKIDKKPIIKISKKKYDIKDIAEELISKKTNEKEKIRETPKIKQKEEKVNTKPQVYLEQKEMKNDYKEKKNQKEEIIQKKIPPKNEDINKIQNNEMKNNIGQIKKDVIKKEEIKNNNIQIKKDEINHEDKIDININNVKGFDKNNYGNNVNYNKIKNDIINNENEKISPTIEINNKNILKPNINRVEISNNHSPDVNKKMIYKANIGNISPEKQKKKDQKAYSNFILNIKKANKKKKGGKLINLLKNEESKQKREDPKAKLSRAIRKLSLLNRTFINTFKDINKDNDNQKTINSPLISNIREDILNTKEETNHNPRNLSCKKISTEDVYNRDNYTGFILMKYDEGEKIIEVKLDNIDKINNIFNKENLQINNREVELIYKDKLEKIKYENERIELEFFKLKDEYNKQKELINYYENIKQDYNKQKELLNSYVNLKDEYNKQKELLDSYEDLKEDYNRQKELINKYENEKKEYEKQKQLLIYYENERKEYDKVRELLIQYENERNLAEGMTEEELKISIRKKAKEKENIQMEEDKIKINEIKNRIQNYKDELRKGGGDIRSSCKVNLNNKNNFNFEQNIRDSNNKKQNKIEQENRIKKNEIKEFDENLYEAEKNEKINNIIVNNLDNNNIENSYIFDNYNKREKGGEMRNNNDLMNNNEDVNKSINIQKRQNNINVVSFNEPDKKDKSYSRALDRIKKKYNKDNNSAFKSKKSQKINDMAKKLENIMGKPQSVDMKDKKDSEPEVFREGKTAEILQSQTLSVKKVKKPHRPKI